MNKIITLILLCLIFTTPGGDGSLSVRGPETFLGWITGGLAGNADAATTASTQAIGGSNTFGGFENLILKPLRAVSNPIASLSGTQVTDISASDTADPFLFFDKGMWYMFYEVHQHGVGSNSIAYSYSLNGLTDWTYGSVLINDHPYHTSWPYVFTYEGNYYMIPCSTKQGVRIYKASSFPTGWTVYEDPDLGIADGGNDPTLFKLQDKWWILISLPNEGLYDLHAYYADTPMGAKWTPHPLNPLLVKNANARSAGRPIVRDDYIIYFTQQGTTENGSLKYGTKVRGYKVNITPTTFSQTELATSPIVSNSCVNQNEDTCTSYFEQWNSDGLHTLNMWLNPDGVSGLAVVDGFSKVTYKYSIGLYAVERNLEIIKAAILGAVEGITEFLPVSSTGHLILAGDMLGFNSHAAKTFEVFIQLGAILAVVWMYRKKIFSTAISIGDKKTNGLILNLLTSLLPTAFFVLIAHSFVKLHFFNPVYVAVGLIVGGIAILLIERVVKKPVVIDVADVSLKQALGIGIVQTLSLFPGVSRAGATIMGAMCFGLERKAATDFSFFLAIPTMFAAVPYELLKGLHNINIHYLPVFAVGFIVSFLSALIVINAFLGFVKKHSFESFAVYRIIFGAAVLLYYMK